jgi:hypothetical protein
MTESQDERLGLPSASSWRRYELCAGSWQLAAEARRLGQEAHLQSPEARRGELIHAWLAGEVDEDGSEIKLSESEQTTADFLQERAQDQVRRIFGDQPALELAEKRLWLELGGRKALSGRFDRVVYTPGVALAQDFKTGFSEPDPAEQNSQMKVLAVLVALHMPPTLQEVIVQIVSGPFGVTEARYDLAALAKAYNEILATLRAIQDPMAPLVPSPDACRWCPAINICQAVRNLSMPITKLQTSKLPDGERAAKLLDEVAVIGELLDSIKEHYAQRLTADPAYDLPGYAMVPGALEREITDWKTAKLRLGEYLEPEQLELAASYGIGKIEDALAKVLKVPKAQAKEKFNAILGDLVQLKQKKSSLKRVSKRGLVEVTLP